ncbi:unnamed protein product, partial [Brenthis ino]
MRWCFVFLLSVHLVVGSRVILVENAPTCFKRVLAGKRALRSHVRRVVDCERLEDCRRECATERRFHCESFNYRLDPTFRGKGLCELMTKPIEAFDIHQDFVEDKDFDFYELDRNSLEPYCPETLRGPGLLHSGFLSSKSKGQEQNNWKDRIDYSETGHKSYNRFYDERRTQSHNRRYEDQFYVPYQIGIKTKPNDDREKWGQYGGSYGGVDSYYKDRNDYRDSVRHWKISDQPPYSHGVKTYTEDRDFDYRSLRTNSGHDNYEYGYGSWKKGQWTGSGSFWKDFDANDYHHHKHSYEFEGRSEESAKDCSSRRSPGMSLGSGSIRRSLLGHTVVECEAACFNEREFKCVSYSYRYSSPPGSDNCFLSERPYQGLQMSADSGSDVYAMPIHKDCLTISSKPWVESECFWHVRSGAAVSGVGVRAALTVAGLGACEAECLRANGFFCRGFSFRFDPPTIGDDLENCLLTSSPPTSLELNHGLRPSKHELYARGNYGRGCEPALYDDVKKEPQCYLQYESSAKLSPSSIRGQARAKDERACGNACTDAPFRCLSFSFSNNASPDKENCLLSEIRLFDLHRGVDYVHSDDDLLFSFDLFNGQCWRKVHGKEEYDVPTLELPHPLSAPAIDEYHGPASGPDLLPPPEIYIPSSGSSGSDFSGPPIKPYIHETGPGYKPSFEPSGPVKPSYLPESGPGISGPSGPSGPNFPDFKPHSRPDYIEPGYKPSFLRPYKPSYDGYKPDDTRPVFKPNDYGPDYKPDHFRPSFKPDDYRPAFKPEGYGPDNFRPGYKPDVIGPSYRPDLRPSGPYLPGPSGPSAPSGPPSLKPSYGPRPESDLGFKPNRPSRPGDRVDDALSLSWRHYTVSGFPCRKGSACEQNLVAGHWACEPEGGEIGSWDYCCAPTHRCGYSEGFRKPWCYVGPSPDQWRPCSEKYYPYHQHKVPHPSLGTRGYTRVPTEDRPHIKYQRNPPPPASGHWVPVSESDDEPAGGLGVPRYWPVSYLHKGPPPNTTYFRYSETSPTTEKYYTRTTPPREQFDYKRVDLNKPIENDIESRSIDDDAPRTEKRINITSDDDLDLTVDNTTTNKPATNETNQNITEKEETLNNTEIPIPSQIASIEEDHFVKGIDGKLHDFTHSLEVFDLDDIKGDKPCDKKTLEAEERQIEAIGRLIASRRGGKLIVEKRSQKDLESKSISLDKDFIDFNFGNRFPTSERRGVVQKVSKDDIEKDRFLNDKSLEVSETTFVRPPRVLSTTENIKKAVVNGKVFYDATIRDQRELFNNTRRGKNLRLEENRGPVPNGSPKKKNIRTRNTNPIRRVRRVYRKRYNPEEVRKRLLEREKNKTEVKS